MGQYYKFINIDKKKEPKERVGFAKLTEHSYLGNEYCESVLSLLSNKWKGDRVIHIGDYAEDGDGASTDNLIKKLKHTENIQELYHNDFETERSLKNSNKIRYVFNHDKREFIDLFKQPIQWVGIDKKELFVTKFDSFALLTACGNGLGGGDYAESCVNSNKVGYWAGDHFTSSSEFLKEYADYKENTFIFNEMNQKLSGLKDITNWDESTEEIIINCGQDLIENTLNNYKNEIDLKPLKLDDTDLLTIEKTHFQFSLDKIQEQQKSIDDIEM